MDASLQQVLTYTPLVEGAKAACVLMALLAHMQRHKRISTYGSVLTVEFHFCNPTAPAIDRALSESYRVSLQWGSCTYPISIHTSNVVIFRQDLDVHVMHPVHGVWCGVGALPPAVWTRRQGAAGVGHHTCTLPLLSGYCTIYITPRMSSGHACSGTSVMECAWAQARAVDVVANCVEIIQRLPVSRLSTTSSQLCTAVQGVPSRWQRSATFRRCI